MKTIKLLAFVIIAFTLSQCSDELFDIKFGLNTVSGEFTIDTTSKVGVIPINEIVYQTKIDSLAKKYKADTSKIESIKVKNAKLTILSPADMTFDAVNSGIITLSATGKPLITIAEFTSIPIGVKTFEITPLDINLMPYLKKNSIIISGNLVTNRAIVVPIKVKLEVNFEVIANPTN